MIGKKIEKNNVTIVLNVLPAKKKIYLAYISKHKSNREKQNIILMIPTEKDGTILQSKNY